MYSYKCLQHVTILLYSTVFLDDDKVINKKVKKVLMEGLNPVLCIGETKEEYEAGLNREVCILLIVYLCACVVCINRYMLCVYAACCRLQCTYTHLSLCLYYTLSLCVCRYVLPSF